MRDGRWWRVLAGGLLPVVVAGLAGCSGGGGSSTVSGSVTGTAAATAGLFSAAQLRGALLTRVNGGAAGTPVTVGGDGALSAASTGRPAANAVQVSPSTCDGAAAAGFGS